MSGPEALQSIRTILPAARFILSSGYTAQATLTELTRAGADDLLEKPYDPDRLLRAVRRVLDIKR